MTDLTLLERADQQQAIERALREGRHAGGHVLAIEGAPGIGKSRLLAEVRRAAGPGQRVLAARASELERGFAFGVVRQLFEGIVRSPELRGSILEGAAGASADVFEGSAPDGSAASFSVLHGLYWLTLNLAELGPVVLAVDDLHWCDTASLRFLAYLARRLEGTDILLAGATRPIAPDNPDAQLLADLLDQSGVEHVYPQALSPAATAALLADQLGTDVDPTFTDACFAATDGNPLLLRQLARSLEAEGIAPTAANAAGVRRLAHRALARTVLARIRRRSPQAAALARAVSVLGGGADPALVAALAEIDPEDVPDTWRELIDADVLRRDELAFVHALVRDAVYLDLPEPSRAALHLRAARILDAAGAPAQRVASQLQLAPRAGDQWAADVAFRAGEEALRQSDPDAAARHLRRALEEPVARERRKEVLMPLATALFDVDAPAAIDVFAELADLETDPDVRNAIQIGRVQTLALTDRWTEAAHLAKRCEDELPPEQHDERAMYEAMRSVTGIFGADPDTFPRLTEYRELRPGAGIGERMRAGQAALMWMHDGGTAEECADLAAAAVGNDPAVLRDLTLIAVAPLYVLALADREDGMALWERATAEAHRSGSVILHVTVSMWLGIIKFRRGDLTGSISGLTDALAFAERWGTGAEPLRYAQCSLALAYNDSGQIAEARALLDRSRPPADSASLSALLWWHAEAWTLNAERRFEEALLAAEEIEQRAQVWARQPIGFDWNLPRAVALHRLERVDEAREAAERGVESARQWGPGGMLGGALRVLGEVSGNDGVKALEESVAMLESTPARMQYTRSLVNLGATLRRRGDVARAREPLERGYDLAVACGSPLLAEAARTELAASGVRRRDNDLGGAAGLTPSERRVADLAAEGRTNREIAQELFVTPKTVEVHLSAAYRKLGIDGRRELAAALQPA
ncbi:MAG: AAA family ATPase [Solirubrobacteraceae bacterium]|nr:AAA family ATPase [Solirubrobacteraceae bacterium]